MTDYSNLSDYERKVIMKGMRNYYEWYRGKYSHLGIKKAIETTRNYAREILKSYAGELRKEIIEMIEKRLEEIVSKDRE